MTKESMTTFPVCIFLNALTDQSESSIPAVMTHRIFIVQTVSYHHPDSLIFSLLWPKKFMILTHFVHHDNIHKLTQPL